MKYCRSEIQKDVEFCHKLYFCHRLTLIRMDNFQEFSVYFENSVERESNAEADSRPCIVNNKVNTCEVSQIRIFPSKVKVDRINKNHVSPAIVTLLLPEVLLALACDARHTISALLLL